MAAANLFARNGLAATRMQDIARASNISLGLAYHYFSSKEELFNAIVDIAITASLKSYRMAAALTGSGIDRLKALVEFIFPHAFGGEGEAFFHIMIQVMTMESVPAQAIATLQANWPLYTAELSRIFQAGIDDGSIRRAPVDQLVMILSSLIQGTSVLSFFGRDEVEFIPKPETVLQLFAP